MDSILLKICKSTPNKIIDNLYLGNATDSENKEGLSELGIKHILIAGNFLFAKFPENFTYKQIKIIDDPDESVEEYFEEAYKYIKEGIEAGGCFVHCAAGISRSTTFICAYLMKEKNWKMIDAYNFVLECRPIVYPNLGFQKQLLKYEVSLGLTREEDYKNLINLDKYSYLRDDY